MNRLLVLTLSLLISSISFTSLNAQKKVRNFVVTKEFNIPANQIWQVVGEDYGAIANSHPAIIHSEYINGSLGAGEGAERVCNFNDEGTRFLREKMMDYNPDQMSFVNQVYQAGKFPVDPDYTKAVYQVEDLGEGKSRLTFDMNFRTKPAIMGFMMQNSFKKLIEDYFIAIEHHIKTGERVNQENFKSIKDQYVLD